jgi:ubiquinone/menaquinone biosynthesis C-methylase UbiE
VDIIADAHYLPFKENSFDEVKAYHILEHLNFIEAMDEIYRVLKPNGILHVKTPHPFSPWFYDNPTHKTFITSWSYNFYSNWSEFQRKDYFEIESIKLNGKFDFILNLDLKRSERILKFLPWNYELEAKLCKNVK